MELFHGSNTIVDQPKIITDGHYKDFGYGFYCTNLERQAKRWALVKKNNHIVNIYDYQENKNLNILIFDEMTDEWLNFVVDCRRGIKHNYDIVEGPMADDTVWNYVNDFLTGRISSKQFLINLFHFQNFFFFFESFHSFFNISLFLTEQQPEICR